MSRCICCNSEMYPYEMRRRKPDGSPEDMCSRCVSRSREKFTIWDFVYPDTDILGMIDSDGKISIEDLPIHEND